jgi:hypothetical protein
LHISNPLSSLLQLLSFQKLLSVLALILLFIVPHQLRFLFIATVFINTIFYKGTEEEEEEEGGWNINRA